VDRQLLLRRLRATFLGRDLRVARSLNLCKRIAAFTFVAADRRNGRLLSQRVHVIVQVAATDDCQVASATLRALPLV